MRMDRVLWGVPIQMNPGRVVIITVIGTNEIIIKIMVVTRVTNETIIRVTGSRDTMIIDNGIIQMMDPTMDGDFTVDMIVNETMALVTKDIVNTSERLQS